MPSPVFQFSLDGTTWLGADVALAGPHALALGSPGTVVHARLVSTSGVARVDWDIKSKSDGAPSPTVVRAADQSATITIDASVAATYLLRATVGGALESSLAIKVLTSAGYELLAAAEEDESNRTYGWVSGYNAAVRGIGGGGGGGSLPGNLSDSVLGNNGTTYANSRTPQVRQVKIAKSDGTNGVIAARQDATGLVFGTSYADGTHATNVFGTSGSVSRFHDDPLLGAVIEVLDDGTFTMNIPNDANGFSPGDVLQVFSTVTVSGQTVAICRFAVAPPTLPPSWQWDAGFSPDLTLNSTGHVGAGVDLHAEDGIGSATTGGRFQISGGDGDIGLVGGDVLLIGGGSDTLGGRVSMVGGGALGSAGTAGPVSLLGGASGTGHGGDVQVGGGSNTGNTLPGTVFIGYQNIAGTFVTLFEVQPDRSASVDDVGAFLFGTLFQQIAQDTNTAVSSHVAARVTTTSTAATLVASFPTSTNRDYTITVADDYDDGTSHFTCVRAQRFRRGSTNIALQGSSSARGDAAWENAGNNITFVANTTLQTMEVYVVAPNATSTKHAVDITVKRAKIT